MDWESQNTGIATINFSGESAAVGVGSTTIHGCITRTIWYNWGSGYCEPWEDLICNYAPIEVRPRVTITPFEMVGRDATFSVPVHVVGNTNNSQITLQLRKLSGTGLSQFSSNNSSTITITQTGNYEIKGVTESSIKDNYVIEAQLDSTVLASETFSIAKVQISRTIGTGQPTEVTDTTINTIVGERIKLSSEVIPSGLTVSSHNWVIPEKIVKEFFVNSATRTPTVGHPKPVDDLTTAAVNF